MSTAYARRIKAQGSERFLKVGSRLFTWHHMANGKGRELSEVLDYKPGNGIRTIPGYVRGAKHYGFSILASAAHNRQAAARERDGWRRRRFIDRAYQDLQSARDFGKPDLPWLIEAPVVVERRRAA